MKRVQDIDTQLAQIGNNTLKLRNNDLPFVKINGRKNIMFNRKDIEEYYKNNK